MQPAQSAGYQTVCTYAESFNFDRLRKWCLNRLLALQTGAN